MSWGGYIPGDLLNDPTFLEALKQSYVDEPYLPGMELVDEDEGESTASLPPFPTSIYRVVDKDGKHIEGYQAQHFYTKPGPARGRATKLNKNTWDSRGQPFRAQRVIIADSEWEDL